MAGMSAEDKKYQSESDMRTLVDAAIIKRDKPRHKAAMELVRKQRTALSDITEGKDDD